MAQILASVDLHCHILPNIDDGARDVEDAVAMAMQAQRDGIAAVCATPHIRHDHDVRIRELPERLAELRAAIAAAGCSTRILAGGEVAATAVRGLTAAEIAAVTLGRAGRWVLLEPGPGPLDDDFDAAVSLLAEQGRRALIAHPERHLAEKLVPRLRRLISEGALVQATAATVTAPESREGMLELIRAGVIHVLASDAHSSRAGRPVALSAALSVLSQTPPVAAHIDWVARHAPSRIVNGMELTPPF